MKTSALLKGRVFLVLLVTLLPAAAVESLTERWRVETMEDGGALPELTQGSTERGAAYDPTSNRFLFVSRSSGSPEVLGVNTTNAEFDTFLDMTGVGGGIFDLNMIGVADDGAVYACNLVLGTSSEQFIVYRWPDDEGTDAPTIAFAADPAGTDEFGESFDPQRWGDTIDVRGSGTGTQILIGSRESPKVAVLTTTDGLTFASTPLAGVGNSNGNLGVAFGPGDTIYTKTASQPLRHSSFDLGAGTAALLNSFATLPNSGRPIAVDAANSRLALLVTNVTPPLVQLYDISSPGLAPVLSDSVELSTSNSNPNATGAADFGTDALFVLQTNNGIAGYDIEDDNQVAPPVIETQPFSQEVIAGGSANFSVVVSGTPPFDFQWKKDTVDIPGATGSSLTIPVVAAADAGSYTLEVSNTAGSVTSAAAVLTVRERSDGEIGSPKWQLAPGDRAYLATDNAQRGMDVNPTNGNVLVASRTGGDKVMVLDGGDGSDLRSLDMTGVGDVAGATFQLSMLGVATDGAVYASNLSLSGDQYRIYRWADDAAATVATIAFDAGISGNPTPTKRLGDTLAVRGSGTDTQILAATRNTTEIVLFTTADGTNFTATAINVTGATGNFGLGLSFGAGNTFWGNTQGGNLYRCDFDPGAGTASVSATFTPAQFPGSIGPIRVAPQYGLLAGISNENPDNLQIFDISNGAAPPVLLDQEFLPTDNANTNGTGSLAFGDAALVGLGTNNGLICLALDVTGRTAPFFLSDVRPAPGDRVLFTLNGELGKSYIIQDSPDMVEWDPAQQVTLTDSQTREFNFPTFPGKRFYRAVEVDD